MLFLYLKSLKVQFKTEKIKSSKICEADVSFSEASIDVAIKQV